MDTDAPNAQGELAQLRKTLENIEQSLSWKITRPLRWGMARLRRLSASRFAGEKTWAKIEATRARIIADLIQLGAARHITVAYAGNGGPIFVTKGAQRFILSAEHYMYAGDLCLQFDYYATSTVPEEIDGMQVFDYSKPGWHRTRDSGERIYYTSLAEDTGSIRDYIKYLAPRAGEVILDVGAYCGLSVLAFSRAVGPTGRVIAFEPDPRNYEALQINVAESGTTNVVTENQAMSGRAGTLLFSSEGNMGSALVAKETERGRTIEVQSTTLRDVVERHNLERVGAVKLDIEGAEYGVIESSVDIIGQLGARWAIELHADPVTGTPADINRVRTIFDRLGYLTVLQHAGETTGGPTLFAYPRNTT
jgi:FkbM family methyltransferase